MKILVVPKEFPHSKVIGGPILIYNRLKYLSKNHQVGLATFIREGDKQYLPSVEPFCTDLETMPYPRPRSIPKRIWDFWFSPVPPYMCNTKSEQMKKTVGEMAVRGKYDIVIAEYTVMGQYLYNNEYLPEDTIRVISCHESYYVARKRSRDFYGRFSKTGLVESLRLRGLRKYEFAMYRSTDKVLTLTPEEKQGVLALAPDLDIAVVPHGVDVDTFIPASQEPAENAIMFLGNYPHDPNRDAVIWFLETMWDRIRTAVPDAHFYIVGNKPTPDILAYQDQPGITVTGRVDEVVPWLQKARVFACPIRLGKGFRGKVLEAMAAGLPVVSTPLGAEGLPVEDGSNILLGHDPATFAEQVVRLLKDDNQRRQIGQTGCQLVRDKFSYEAGVQTLESVFQNLLQKKGKV
jgi:glycosyltransferase involved in cell wall biosynthesis